MRARLALPPLLLAVLGCEPPPAEPLPRVPVLPHAPAAPEPAPPPQLVTVRVVDESGRPVAGAEVYEIVRRTGESMPPPLRSESVTTDDTGTAQLPDSAGTMAIVATRAGWPAQATRGVSRPIVLGPPRTVAGRLAMTDCPNGYVELRVETRLSEIESSLAPSLVTTAADGSFAISVGPGEYFAHGYACGRPVDARFSGRDRRLELALPVRPSDRPRVAPITVTTKPPPSHSICRFQPWSTARLVAGDFGVLYVDDRCRLFVRGVGWSAVSATGGTVPLGETTESPSGAEFPISRWWAAFPVGADTRIVALNTGNTETLHGRYEVAFAPHQETFALRKQVRGAEPLEVRLSNGTRRHVSARALELVWTDDGRLAYLEETPQHGPSRLHLYDPIADRDHELGAASYIWSGVAGHLIVVRDRGVLASIDLQTLSDQTLAENPYNVNVVAGAALYESFGQNQNHQASSLWDAATNTVTDVSAVIGSNTYDLRTGPHGELLLVGHDVAVASAGKLRVLCEDSRILDVAGDTVLCREGSARVIAAALDGSHSVALPEATSLSSSGTWAAGPHALVRTDGKKIVSYSGTEGRWAPDRDTFYVLEDKALLAIDAATGRKRQLAPAAQAFVPIDGGRVLYAVAGDGVYLAGP